MNNNFVCIFFISFILLQLSLGDEPEVLIFDSKTGERFEDLEADIVDDAGYKDLQELKSILLKTYSDETINRLYKKMNLLYNTQPSVETVSSVDDYDHIFVYYSPVRLSNEDESIHQVRVVKAINDSIKIGNDNKDQYFATLLSTLPRYEKREAFQAILVNPDILHSEQSVESFVYGTDNLFLQEFYILAETFALESSTKFSKKSFESILDLIYDARHMFITSFRKLKEEEDIENYKNLYKEFEETYRLWDSDPNHMGDYSEIKFRKIPHDEWYFFLKALVYKTLDLTLLSDELNNPYPTYIVDRIKAAIEIVKPLDRQECIRAWLILHDLFKIELSPPVVVKNIKTILTELIPEEHRNDLDVIFIAHLTEKGAIRRAIRELYGKTDEDWSSISLEDFDCDILSLEADYC